MTVQVQVWVKKKGFWTEIINIITYAHHLFPYTRYNYLLLIEPQYDILLHQMWRTLYKEPGSCRQGWLLSLAPLLIQPYEGGYRHGMMWIQIIKILFFNQIEIIHLFLQETLRGSKVFKKIL